MIAGMQGGKTPIHKVNLYRGMRPFALALFALLLLCLPYKISTAKSIVTEEKQLVLIKGQTYRPRVSGGNGIFRFKSSDSRIAVVNQKTGKIIAKKNGKCRYIITSGNQRAVLAVTVRTYLLPGHLSFIAHRGEMNKAPEDTLASFKLAKKEGYKMYECDLRRTDSGAYIIYHDINGYRIGVNSNVSVNTFLTYENLKQYPVVRHTFGYKYETIPTLENALLFAKRNNMRMFIHFKPDVNWNEQDIINVKEIIDRTGTTANAYPFVASPRVVGLMSKYFAHYGFHTVARDASTVEEHYRLVERYHPDFFWFRVSVTGGPDKQLVQYINKNGTDVGAFPVRSKQEAARLINIGAKYCVSDLRLFKTVKK